MTPWIEQPRFSAGLGINCFNLVVFVVVAGHTSPGEISEYCLSAA